MSQSYAIGIDLGGTNIKAALVADDGAIAVKSKRVCDPARGPEPVVNEMAQMCAELTAEAGISRERIVGVGLGTPGPLDFDRGMILKAANLPGWIEVPIRDWLQSSVGFPVVLENDANAAAFGEFWAGSGRGGGDMVMLTLGTGVGSGVIVNDRLLRGHFGNAAELGHMIVVPAGLLCGCGQRGCLEQYASASAVARRVHSAIQAGAPATLAAGSMPNARDIEQAARAGDELCRRIWQEACLYLAVACVNIQHAFNPATIILGGGLAEAGDFLLDPVRDEFKKQTWSLCNDQPSIIAAALGYDAGVIGAAGLAWRSQQ